MSEINGVRVLEQRTYELTISDGDVMPASEHRPHDRQFRVEYAVLNYRRHDGDVWILDTPKIGGTVLRGDGSESKNRTSRHLPWKRAEWPGWVVELAGFYNPTNPNPTTTASEDR